MEICDVTSPGDESMKYVAMERPGQMLMPHTGKGKELGDLLRNELGIPRACRWFEIRFAVNEIVTVKTEFFATEQPKAEGD